MNNCPVTLEEFKRHLRIYNDEMDDNLIIALEAAVNDIENFTLINFEEDYDGPKIPQALKSAILLTAGRLFENPTDSVDRLTSVSKNLAQPFKRWDRIKK